MSIKLHKERLSVLLRRGTLTAQEREAFNDMWDAAHRYGKLTNKQVAWLESVFFKQKLDQPGERPIVERSPTVGWIYDPSAKRTTTACSFEQFKTMCPHIAEGTPAFERVKKFFRHGGVRFELRAGERPKKA